MTPGPETDALFTEEWQIWAAMSAVVILVWGIGSLVRRIVKGKIRDDDRD